MQLVITQNYNWWEEWQTHMAFAVSVRKVGSVGLR